MRHLPFFACALLLAACPLLRPDPQAQIARLANTSWRVESIGGTEAFEEIESTLRVDAEAHVAGRGGCNPYVSDIGVEAGAIRFAKVLAAEFSCTPEQVDQEKRFFDALANTRALRTERGRLNLLDEAGKTLVRLKSATLLIKGE